MKLFTKFVLLTSVAFFTSGFITKVTGIQVRKDAIQLSDFDIDPLLADLLAVLSTLFTASVGDVEDECLSAALLLSLHITELVILVGPQGVIGASCKLFNSIAKAIMLMFVKTCWELTKPYIRRNEDPAAGVEGV